MFIFLFFQLLCAQTQANPFLESHGKNGFPIYEEVTKTAQYLTMRDGVRIAIDVYLPKTNPGTKLPTLMEQTRYWRSPAGQPGILPTPSFFAERGYAVVMVDVRGSGASFGSRPQLYDTKEVEDSREILDWIVKQPWSNGSVGVFGVSYTANTAALTASLQHPAVKIAIPQFYDYDLFTDLVFPGGIMNKRMLVEWGRGVKALDKNIPGKGVAPVDGPDGKRLLKQAVAARKHNIDVGAEAKKVDFKDTTMGAAGSSMADMSLYPYQAKLKDSATLQYLWASWLDAGTAQGLIHQLMNDGGDHIRAVIGPWNHGGEHHTSPYLAPEVQPTPTMSNQRQAILNAFDSVLRGEVTTFTKIPRLTYYTMGEERWHTADQWPPPGLSERIWYMDKGGKLGTAAPTKQSKTNYKVDFSSTTGKTNRWASQFNGDDIIYPDRAEQDRKNLLYTSEPLTGALEITGWPVVELLVESTHADGAIYVYLEDVAPTGRVTYLTEGQLRLIHGPGDDNSKPYHSKIPYLSYAKADAQPMVPGESVLKKFALLPTSVVLQKGHRLRLSIAGADKHTFQRYPKKGRPELTFHHGQDQVARLILPSKLRPDLDRAEDGKHLPILGEYGDDQASFMITEEAGLPVLRAKNPAALQRLDVGALSQAEAKPYVTRFHQVIEAIKKKDEPFLKEWLWGNNLPEILELSELLNHQPSLPILGVWLERGLVRIAIEFGLGEEVFYPQFLFDVKSQKLYYFYDNQPMPGGIRLMADGKNQYRSLDQPNWHAKIERDPNGKAIALVLGERRFPRKS